MLVDLLLLLVLRRVHFDVAGAYHIIVLVSLGLQLLPLGVSLLLGHYWVLVLPPIELLCLVLLHLLLSSLTQVQQGYCLKDHVVLDLLVQRTISGERSQAIHFDKPGFDLIVYEDVNT